VLKFLIGEITNDVSGMDTTKPNTLLDIQVLRPAGIHDSNVQKALSKKFIPWRGDDNKLYKLSLERRHVKAVVELTPLGSKLTKKSLKLIKNNFF
jgi:hypothetical protein